jgi:uncharacterized protein (TIGR02284 family)
MAESTQEFISTLNDLIETCKEGERGFREAADGISGTDLKSILNEYARQRSQFASELQNQVIRLGGDPEKSGSVSGSMHRGWINLKSAITGKDDHSILAECERGEDSAVKNYQEALEKDLPSDLRSVVEDQYQDILDAHNRIKSMRDMSDTDLDRSTSDVDRTTTTSRMDEYSKRRTY